MVRVWGSREASDRRAACRWECHGKLHCCLMCARVLSGFGAQAWFRFFKYDKRQGGGSMRGIPKQRLTCLVHQVSPSCRSLSCAATCGCSSLRQCVFGPTSTGCDETLYAVFLHAFISRSVGFSIQRSRRDQHWPSHRQVGKKHAVLNAKQRD